MRYVLGMRDDGWLIVDRDAARIAKFAGCELKGLSREEAETMIDLLTAIERATQVSLENRDAA